MAAIDELSGSKKRKRDSSSLSKKGKPFGSKPAKFQSAGGSKKDPKSFKSKPVKTYDAFEKKKEPTTPREKRLAAKEMAEERKKKRKPNYNLEKELASLWEKMRRRNVSKEEKSKLISEALRRMNEKYLEIASSHVSARVLQTCIKYCSQTERETIFEALRPHFLTLSRKKYAVHLVNKLLDTATKKQLEAFISSLHGQVSSLLRHTVGSAVVDHAYQLAKGSQKQRLLMEMYSTELQLFKDLTLTNSGRLVDIISKLGLQKSSVLQHMTSVIQPILEKGILDYSIIHTCLLEYFTIADKSSATDVIQQLLPLLTQESSGIDEGMQASKKRKIKKIRTKIPLLVRMVSTRDGLKVGILCIKHGSAKERKKIVKGIKEHVRNLTLDQCGSVLLTCILSVVDDTKLVTKIIIDGLKAMLKELVLDRNGRLLLLQLLHPQCARYLGPENLACLASSVPSLCAQGEEEATSEEGSENRSQLDVDVPMMDIDKSGVSEKSMKIAIGGKKDPFIRRRELLVESGLAESLINTCIENANELLRSNFGKEVIFEVAVGGADGILQSLSDKLADLHKAIASLAALPKEEDDSKEEDHVFENFHSSRTIRKLILDSPSFAAILWKMALEGKCEMWAHGHSCKVVSAFLESKDSTVRNLSKLELQPLINRGVLKAPTGEQLKKKQA
ncbi:uncharacterized protein A4U43_C08F31840 [Asparagus officinalis]|uniref:pumilio homolog 24 n=1 Tax=Asparagus officinalis TaxID=4686 RepID=UPI00098E79EB|nr:pumilio homolog 24 [Asparagus officinalis]ONK61619.1 uncharacterized protein A4U43_C08F31840 [Asparagus officinalis]